MQVRNRRWREGLAVVLLASSLSACARKEPGVPAVTSPGQARNETRVWQEADTPRRNPEAAFREVGDEGGLVVLPSRAEVKVLNPTGSRVFSLLDGKRTLGTIARAVTDEFEVDYATALEDVITFVKELEANGMLAAEEVLAVPEK